MGWAENTSRKFTNNPHYQEVLSHLLLHLILIPLALFGYMSTELVALFINWLSPKDPWGAFAVFAARFVGVVLLLYVVLVICGVLTAAGVTAFKALRQRIKG
jgi:TRAP-type C4-dicarboxylate transport system permease small subunit